MINSTVADPIFISELLEENYGHLINNRKLSEKLKYNIPNNENYDDLIRSFMKHNNRKIPDNVKIRVAAGGCSICISAFYYAIYKIKNRPITVGSTVPPPYYLLHKELCEKSGFCTWVDDNTVNVDIEVNVSPNNPNGTIQPPNYKGEYIMLDSIYDFYQFTKNPETVNPWVNWNNNFVMINSLSKFGFAGARIGEIMSKNDEIINYCQEFLSQNTLGTNTFAIDTLKCIINKININSVFIDDVYKTLRKRLHIVRNIIPKELIYSNTKVPFVFCKLSYKFFEKLNIIVSRGKNFGVSNNYSRLELMMTESDFVELVKRLKTVF